MQEGWVLVTVFVLGSLFGVVVCVVVLVCVGALVWLCGDVLS